MQKLCVTMNLEEDIKVEVKGLRLKLLRETCSHPKIYDSVIRFVHTIVYS